MNIEKLYRTELIALARSDKNYHHLDHAQVLLKGSNPSCGDHLAFELVVEQSRIKDIAFAGEGCIVSRASSTILCDILRGQTLDQSQKILKDFFQITHHGQGDAELENKISILKGALSMPPRVKCVTLAWQTILEYLNRPNK